MDPPKSAALPTGRDLVERYLAPLARVPAIRDRLVADTRVVAVGRDGVDKARGLGREEHPFVVRSVDGSGMTTSYLVRAAIDASGTWSHPNPLGAAGLPTIGEESSRHFVAGPMPDVLGAARERHAGKHTLVIGSGHSAANTLINLADLARQESGTQISWAIRRTSAERAYGGGGADGLPARGALGSDIRELVEQGIIRLLSGFQLTELIPGPASVTVSAKTSAGDERFDVDVIVGATGFRPDLEMLRELRLDMDPGLEAPRDLAPMIDPDFHSCGTVEPHGAQVLAHPEPDFYVVGMKSYARAPTFLMATGYEQVRSIAAELAGDHDGATLIELDLPETGVCSSAAPGLDPQGDVVIAEQTAGGCCAAPVPVSLEIGTAHGRSGC